jgi:16S rRNA (cytosine967-C5)-methyltransferase
LHNIQLLAAQAVGQVLAGRNLNQVLDEIRRLQPGLVPQQRSALQDMSYSTLRWRGRLEALLAALLERPLTDERVRCLLLVALCQLEYGKSAAHAVVDNAVQAAHKFKQPWTRGLVNAVLRNFLRRRDTLVQKVDEHPNTRLSYPDWWITKFQTQYPARWESVLAAGNGHPPMTLRVNRRKIRRDTYLDLLAAQEIAVDAVGISGIRLQRPFPVEKLPGFGEGLVSVQDLGAQYAAPFLEVHDGMRVLDACSAPGGKAAHLLELADIELLALDNDSGRLAKVRDNLHRLDLAATLHQGDAAHVADWWDLRPFDRILADVPCSASGIVRRHPDIKWLRRETDISGFVVQQANILRGLWSTLAKGGKLLYATCSIFQEENYRQIESFLTKTPDALLLALPGLEEGQLLPCDAHDGFYYALLQKV